MLLLTSFIVLTLLPLLLGVFEKDTFKSIRWILFSLAVGFIILGVTNITTILLWMSYMELFFQGPEIQAHGVV
jgi:hypothetical protein